MREVGRGNGMEERSLEIGEVLRGGKEMMETGSRFTHILEKGSRKYLVCLIMSPSWRQIKR